MLLNLKVWLLVKERVRPGVLTAPCFPVGLWVLSRGISLSGDLEQLSLQWTFLIFNERGSVTCSMSLCRDVWELLSSICLLAVMK